MMKKFPILNRPNKRFSQMFDQSKSQKNLLNSLKTLYMVPKVSEPNKSDQKEKLKIDKHLSSTFKVHIKQPIISEFVTPKKLKISHLNHLSPQSKICNKIGSLKSIQLRVAHQDNQQSIIAHVSKNLQRKSRNFISKKSPTLRRSENKQFNSTNLLTQNVPQQVNSNFNSQKIIEFHGNQCNKQKRVHKGKIKMKLLGKNPLQKRINFDNKMVQSIIPNLKNKQELSESFKAETQNFIQMIDWVEQSQQY